MTQSDWNVFAAGFLEQMHSTLVAKGKDYNDDIADRLQNFKSIGVASGADPRQVGAILAAKHWDAITRHCRGIHCTTEPVRERLIDLANYCVLIAALEADLAAPDEAQTGQGARDVG